MLYFCIILLGEDQGLGPGCAARLEQLFDSREPLPSALHTISGANLADTML